MVDTSASLDFESEDKLLFSPVISKKRKQVIGLDDLLEDFYKEKEQAICDSKNTDARNNYSSDEDDNGKEALLTSKINECHWQMKNVSSEEEISTWGICLFEKQRSHPPPAIPRIGNFSLLKPSTSSKMDTVFEVSPENDISFIEGLLLNGWLLKLVRLCGSLEESVAKWIFHLMLYSSNEQMMSSACDFWCTVLSNCGKDDGRPSTSEWFPSYTELRCAIQAYGLSFGFSMQPESSICDSGTQGPPSNIRSWIKFVTACCCARDKFPFLSIPEAKELVEVTVLLFLDRQLYGLLVLLHRCLDAILSYFTCEEWHSSCDEIATSLASRIPKDLNCLKMIEIISGFGERRNMLRCSVAYQILLISLGIKGTGEEEVLRCLVSVNLKDKNCDLSKFYIQLILTQNWLFANSDLLKRGITLRNMWAHFLRNCSCQIPATDLRPYALKVRTMASYFLHMFADK